MLQDITAESICSKDHEILQKRVSNKGSQFLNQWKATYPWKNYYKQEDSHLASAFGIPITAGQDGENAQTTVTAKSDL